MEFCLLFGDLWQSLSFPAVLVGKRLQKPSDNHQIPTLSWNIECMRSFRGTDNHLLDRRQDLGILRRSWQKTQVFTLKYCNRLTAGMLGTSLCFWQTDVLVPTRDRIIIILERNLFGKFYGVRHISNTFTNEVRVIPRNRRQKTCTIYSSRRNISNSALSSMGGEAKRKKSACTWTQHLNQPTHRISPWLHRSHIYD